MEHAAKSTGRCADCPAVHAPASVLLRLPAERAAHSGPRWMSRYLPQTVLGGAMRGLARSSQRLPTERASRSRPVATSRHSMQGAPSAQPAGSGRRAWAAQGARPVQRRSYRPLRFATWAGTRTDSARSRSCTQRNPAGQIAKSEHAGGAARGANPGQRRSRRLARFATWAGTRTGAAQGARPGQRRSRRLARFATWAEARTDAARSRSCAQGALSSSRARFAACGESRESFARAAIPARSLGASIQDARKFCRGRSGASGGSGRTVRSPFSHRWEAHLGTPSQAPFSLSRRAADRRNGEHLGGNAPLRCPMPRCFRSRQSA